METSAAYRAENGLHNEIRLTDNVVDLNANSEQALESQHLQSNNEIRLTDNVGEGKNQPKIAYCEYPPCGKEFVQTVSWKRHCCEDCRIKNWELRNGKTFKRGRKGKAKNG